MDFMDRVLFTKQNAMVFLGFLSVFLETTTTKWTRAHLWWVEQGSFEKQVAPTGGGED